VSNDDFGIAADRILAGFDFSMAKAAIENKHRSELKVLLDGMLGVVDSLDTLEAALNVEPERGCARYLGTVGRIRRQALRVLVLAGVEPIESLGKPLDLATSEVVDVRDNGTNPDDTVIEEVVRGYLWRQALFRRAKVVITRCNEKDTAVPTT
jgi:molecular chaperone GrpE